MDEKYSLAQLQALSPKTARSIQRETVSSYADFIELLYQDLDELISDIQENPEKRNGDDEDRLTIEIRTVLRQLGWEATHDEKLGGHTDLTVRKKSYTWIGEAKIHNGSEYLWGGFQQLTTRYSVGSHNQSEGGLIIYIKSENALLVMQRWRQGLRNRGLEDFVDCDCEANPLAFFSSHKHMRSGLPFKVRHIPIMLFFDPQDKK